MKLCMVAPFALTMTMCAGCQGLVSHGAGGSGGSGVTGAGATPGAIAFRYGDLPVGTLDTSPLSAPPASDALVLVFANMAQTCSDPVPYFSIPPVPCDGDDLWEAELLVPPELDRAGLIDLQDTRILVSGAEATPGCNGGGVRDALGGAGQLDVEGSDGSTLTVKLQGGVIPVETVIDGTYDAVWCSTPPPAAPPAPALAVLGADLPPGASASGTVGAAADPTATYVFLGTAPETCASPVPAAACEGTTELTFRLPAGTGSGTFDLADPQIDAWFVSGCAAGGGQPFSPGQGTIQILGAGAASVSFRVYGSYEGPQFDLDGLYSASICSP